MKIKISVSGSGAVNPHDLYHDMMKIYRDGWQGIAPGNKALCTAYRFLLGFKSFDRKLLTSVFMQIQQELAA